MRRIGFGAEPLGGTDWGDVNLVAAHAAVRRAIELGVELFDTADVYGLGLSEQRLGEALGSDRHRVRIVTKGGLRWEQSSGRANVIRDGSRAHLTHAAEMSLKRLCVERVAFYLLHWPDPTTALTESIDALEDLVRRGLVEAWGLSNHSVTALAVAREANAAPLRARFPRWARCE